MKQPIILMLACLIATGSVSCGSEVTSTEQRRRSEMADSTIAEVLARNTDRLMAIPGVVGVAIGQHAGRPDILVLVTRKTDALMRQIPPELEGFPVVVEETGTIRRLDRPG